MSDCRYRLCDQDARVLDTLAAAGFAKTCLDSMSEEDRRRAARLLETLECFERYPTGECSPQLVDAVLARVDRDESQQRELMRFPAGRRRIFRMRLPDLMTVAAVMLVAIGVGWPILNSMRGTSMRDVCSRNMSQVYAGLSGYAADHDGSLPLTAGFGGFGAAGPDWRTYRHADNLTLLTKGGYIGSRCLTCPGCARDRAALAFRVPTMGERFMMPKQTGTILLADANPLLEKHRSGEQLGGQTTMSSYNHSGEGQNTSLDDGSVRWLWSPVLPNGDNIWLPRGADGIESLDRGIMPRASTDIFLAQ